MLKRIYSPTGLIDEVVFQPGLNIVRGRYTGAEGINGIGKSSLIRLMDFCLLSDSAEKNFSAKKFNFLRDENHKIILEFEIGLDGYEIVRTFGKDDLIEFKDHEGRASYSKKELRAILTNKFFPTTSSDCLIEGDKFRTLMKFFIKDDLNNIQRGDPLDLLGFSSNKVEQAILNFFMYGINNLEVYNYKSSFAEYSDFGKMAKAIENRVKEDLGKELSELKTEKVKIERTVEKLRKTLDEYQFLENYKQVEEDVKDLTLKIKDKLSSYTKISLKIEKLKYSYQRDISVDTERVKSIYDEVLLNFGKLVAKKLDDVIDFKNEILENREKYVSSRIEKLNKDRASIEEDLQGYELERAKKYKILNEDGALDSIKNSYEEYIEKKGDIDQFEVYITQHDSFLSKQSKKKTEVENDKNQIVESISKSESQINDLRELFYEILENAIFLTRDFESSYFDIRLKSKSGINSLPFQIDVEVPKSEALGHSRLKIVAYDLMVFINSLQNQRAMPKFLVHDGVFHAVFAGTIIKSLNYMNSELKQYPEAQYFLTFNEDELSLDNVDERYGKFNFNVEDKIVATYSDSPEGMIFKRSIE